jgi:quinolinate synthase
MSSFVTKESLFEKLGKISVGNPLCSYTLQRCERLAPLINEILLLKEKKKALILAHSYVHPDIIYGVADHTGDSFGLSKIAKDTDAEVILFPAVRFMAETAKILNPSKTVIDPNPNGGCSLADSITADTVYKLREKYPQHTFVCYINTTAAVKAACDVCVTSSNVYSVIEAIANDKIYFLPDKLMGQNITEYLTKKKIDKQLLYYSGTCYVHEEFTSDSIDILKQSHPGIKILAHPECKPDVVKKADVVSSTTGMLDHVKKEKAETPYMLLTECGIASRLQVECPEVRIIGQCMMCKYMKSNSLEMIRDALREPKPSQVIEIAPEIQKGALKCLEAMFSLSG